MDVLLARLTNLGPSIERLVFSVTFATAFTYGPRELHKKEEFPWPFVLCAATLFSRLEYPFLARSLERKVEESKSLRPLRLFFSFTEKDNEGTPGQALAGLFCC